MRKAAMAKPEARLGYVTAAGICVAAVVEGAVHWPRMLERLKHPDLLQC
jgi:hypothetical protein